MFRLLFYTAAFALVLATTACETANIAAGVEPQHTPTTYVKANDGWRLTQAQRQEVRPGFDVEALERFLGHVTPELRDSLFVAFTMPRGNEVQELWYVGDPALQELLEEVWAPKWDRVPLTEIEADRTERPGKRLAIQRRRQAAEVRRTP
jgi:hypothetical protein